MSRTTAEHLRYFLVYFSLPSYKTIAKWSHSALTCSTYCTAFSLFHTRHFSHQGYYPYVRVSDNRVLLTELGGITVFMYSIKNKRRIWDKKVDKHRPRISAARLMRRLSEEFRITRKNTKLFHNDKGVRSHRWYSRSRYHETLSFSYRVNFSRNSRFTISLVSVHRKCTVE